MMAITANTEAITPKMKFPVASETGPGDVVDVDKVSLLRTAKARCGSKGWVRLEASGAIVMIAADERDLDVYGEWMLSWIGDNERDDC